MSLLNTIHKLHHMYRKYAHAYDEAYEADQLIWKEGLASPRDFIQRVYYQKCGRYKSETIDRHLREGAVKYHNDYPRGKDNDDGNASQQLIFVQHLFLVWPCHEPERYL